MVLDLLGKNIVEDGNEWEKLILDCFILRYKPDYHVQRIDAEPGDGGIEGFVSNGIVWQCYAPTDSNLENEKLYQKLIDKITNDIQKIYQANNIKLYQSIGVPIIKEWHFITPRYKGQKVLSHLQKKQEEVRNKIKIEKLTHIHSDFTVYIKDANEFKAEINQLYISHSQNLQFELHKIPIDYSKCDSEKKQNISYKTDSLTSQPEIKSHLIDLQIRQYLKYLHFETKLIALESLREKFIGSVEQLKNGTLMALMMSTDLELTYNQQIETIRQSLLCDYKNIFSATEVIDISNMIMSKWLADCNLDFLKKKDGD